MAKKLTVQEVIDLIKEKRGSNPVLDASSYIGMKRRAVFVDKDYGEFECEPSRVVHRGVDHPKRVNSKIRATYIKKYGKSGLYHNPYKMVICNGCNQEFIRTGTSQLFCSPRCRELSYRENRQKLHVKNSKDLNYKLKKNIRSRIKDVISRDQKAGSAVRDLGCSTDELKLHLESKFQPGMTWENYGYKGWHVDHILPLSSFDLTDREQFLKACHFTNLQPLWAIENLKKGSSVLLSQNKFQS